MSLFTSKPPQTQEEFNAQHMYKEVKSLPFIKAVKTKWDFSFRSVLLSLFPIFTWLPEYECKTNLVSDLMSGFTVSVMHLPQGMAYAALANVNPIVGIYMAVFPTLPYVLMGTSKHISLGAFSITCVMAARPIVHFSTLRRNSTHSSSDDEIIGFELSPEEVASILCVAVGICQVLLGLIQVGHLSVFLSQPIIKGFTTGAAYLVLVSQLPHVFGIKLKQRYGIFSVPYDVLELTVRLQETNMVAFTMSVTVVLCLLLCSDYIEPWLSWKYKLPMEMTLMIFGTYISFLLDLKTNFNLNVVGHLPTGIPEVKFPKFEMLEVPHFWFHSFGIAVVCFVMSISLATVFATKEHYDIDSNQELYAHGFGNIFGGFFPCLPMAASLSRSAIQYTSGGKTQLVTLFSSIFLIFIMVFVKCLDPLPYCVLGGIVIKSLKGSLLQITEITKIWKRSSTDGLIWVIIFLSVILLDLICSLTIGLLLAVLSIIVMNQKTYVCLLGRVPESNTYLEMQRYLTAKPIPGVLLVKIYAGLHFANVNVCLNRIQYLVKKTSKVRQVNVVVLVFSAVLFTDPTALEHLTVFINQLSNREGIIVCVAECTGRVYEEMQRCNFFDKFPEDLFFPTIHDAVACYERPSEERIIAEIQL